MQMGQPYGMPASYAPTGGMMYVPSHHHRRGRYRHTYPSYGYGGYRGPTVVSALPTAVAAPMVMVCCLLADFMLLLLMLKYRCSNRRTVLLMPMANPTTALVITHTRGATVFDDFSG